MKHSIFIGTIPCLIIHYTKNKLKIKNKTKRRVPAMTIVIL